MNVVLVTELFLPGVGGVTTAVRNLAEALSVRGHRVTLICPDSKAARNWASTSRIVLCSVPGLTLPGRVYQRVGAVLPFSCSKVRRAVQDADVVHLHSPVLIGRTLSRYARRSGVPVVVTSHLLPENVTSAYPYLFGLSGEALSRWVWRAIGESLAGANRVISPSAFAARILEERFPGLAVSVVSNGVAEPSLRNEVSGDEAPRHLVRALYVGRLQREKRVDELLVAARACVRAGVRLRLTILGGGPDRRRLEAIMGRLQLQDAVRFVGMVSDRIRDAYYGESDCLWIASRAELQCCAALEAMAAGCPVVAARAGALPETVPDGIAGRLFTPGNPNEIVEIMKGLCRQPERRRLSDGARTVALKHGIARVCSDTLEIYRACV